MTSNEDDDDDDDDDDIAWRDHRGATAKTMTTRTTAGQIVITRPH